MTINPPALFYGPPYLTLTTLPEDDPPDFYWLLFSFLVPFVTLPLSDRRPELNLFLGSAKF